MARPWFLVLGAICLSHVATARADESPPLAPQRDVVVTYHLEGVIRPEGATKMQVTYADHGRVRLDYYEVANSPTAFGSLLFDPPADRVITLVPDKLGYLERDVGKLLRPGMFLNASMHFIRQGSATIAGVQCTDWRVLNGTVEDGTACVTDDGVVLRATRDKPNKGSIEAMTVKYGPPPPGTFAPPPEFKLLQPVQHGTRQPPK